MSIDARVDRVEVYPDGSGKLFLRDRPAIRFGSTPGIAGQAILSFEKPLKMLALSKARTSGEGITSSCWESSGSPGATGILGLCSWLTGSLSVPLRAPRRRYMAFRKVFEGICEERLKSGKFSEEDDGQALIATLNVSFRRTLIVRCSCECKAGMRRDSIMRPVKSKANASVW
jgi:hypothetical protein